MIWSSGFLSSLKYRNAWVRTQYCGYSCPGSGQLVPKTTRTQDNSYPGQLVPKTTRTQDNSYPGQLVPKTTRMWYHIISHIISYHTIPCHYILISQPGNMYTLNWEPFRCRTIYSFYPFPYDDENSTTTYDISWDNISIPNQSLSMQLMLKLPMFMITQCTTKGWCLFNNFEYKYLCPPTTILQHGTKCSSCLPYKFCTYRYSVGP